MIWASAKAKCGSPCWIWLPSTIAYLLSGLYSYFQPEVPEEVRWSHATLSPQSRPALLGDLQWNFWWSCGMELPELEKGRSPKRRWKWTRIEAKMWCEYVMRTFFFLQRLQRRRKMDDLQKLQWQKGTFFRDALQFWWNAHETNLARRISKVYPELVDDWLAESWLNSTVQWKGFFWQVYLLSALCKRTNSWNSPQSSPFIIRQIDIYKNFIINYQLTIYRLWTIYDNLKYL